ncbi:hypothetical protein C8T65DRAFT_693151 [Cerioporus squamosus]|nr:hypothetical protein C8T65DRAFT_693151 [Cerioporus squamosus]
MIGNTANAAIASHHDNTQSSLEQTELSRVIRGALEWLQQPTTGSTSNLSAGQSDIAGLLPHGTAAMPYVDNTLIEWQQLQAHLSKTPTDVDGWLRAVHLAEASANQERIREVYNVLLKIYPCNPYIQIMYIQHCITDNQFGDPDQCFEAFMRDGPRCVGVIMPYLLFVTQKVGDAKSSDRLRRCYAEAVKVAGREKDSGVLWKGYIDILNSCKANTPWEVQQKFNTIRSVYQQAVQIPMDGVAKLWDAYQDFERTIDTAMASLQTAHDEQALVTRWRRYLIWEENDPLKIRHTHPDMFKERVRSAYGKAVVHMRFYPEIWHMAYLCLSGIGDSERAQNLLIASVEANPTSFLLNFAYAEMLEAQQHFSLAKETFEKLLSMLRKQLDHIIVNLNTSREETICYDSGTLQARPKLTELSDRRKEYGVVWIAYIRFIRRTNGLNAARETFNRARQDSGTPWEVHEAAALMEYHYGKDAQAAKAIFKQALESFRCEVPFVLRYMSFLIAVNDESEPPIKRFAERYRYGNIDPIATRDLGFNLNKDNTRVPDRNTIARTPKPDTTVTEMLPNLRFAHESSASRKHALSLGLCTTTAPNEHVEAVQ